MAKLRLLTGELSDLPSRAKLFVFYNNFSQQCAWAGSSNLDVGYRNWGRYKACTTVHLIATCIERTSVHGNKLCKQVLYRNKSDQC